MEKLDLELEKEYHIEEVIGWAGRLKWMIAHYIGDGLNIEHFVYQSSDYGSGTISMRKQGMRENNLGKGITLLSGNLATMFSSGRNNFLYDAYVKRQLKWQKGSKNG